MVLMRDGGTACRARSPGSNVLQPKRRVSGKVVAGSIAAGVGAGTRAAPVTAVMSRRKQAAAAERVLLEVPTHCLFLSCNDAIVYGTT